VTTGGSSNEFDDDLDEREEFLMSVALAVRARRRVQRVNQRTLAARAGVSKSTVARVERGDARVTLPMLRRVLTEVGLDVILVDEDGYPWRDGDSLPADIEGGMDAAGRRLPAHLPAKLTDSLTSWDHCRLRGPLLPVPVRWRFDRYSDDVEAMVREMAAGRRTADSGTPSRGARRPPGRAGLPP
jgi:transcriptional regulator with XRE-family HTH domain